MEIRPFGPAEVDAAARIAAARFSEARLACPLLPAAWEAPAAYVEHLEATVEHGSGVAALRDGELVGYLTAWHAGEGRARRIYVPEWAWGTDPHADATVRRRLVEDLYAAAADDWVGDDRRLHYVCVHADDAAGLDAWASLGFGHAVMDAVRGTEPPAGPAATVPGLTIRRGTADDARALEALEGGLRAHLASSPTFLALGAARSVAEHAARLADPEVATLLGEASGSAVAYLRIGPAATDAATIIRDPGTASISGAFTVPERRRSGVGRALLAAAVAWARQRGYVRVAVDFETANLLAARFWRREFVPVIHSLARRI